MPRRKKKDPEEKFVEEYLQMKEAIESMSDEELAQLLIEAFEEVMRKNGVNIGK